MYLLVHQTPKKEVLMGKKRRTNGKDKDTINELATALSHNGKAKEEGPKKKQWSIFDINTINPLTPAQQDMFQAWIDDYHIMAHGTAGTGKTFLALYLAMNSVLERQQNKVIVVRSAVSTRDVGFLPGDMSEKTQYYELPYHDILHELFNRPSTYEDMKEAGLIHFTTTSFIRGLTWDNAVIVVDEGANMTWHEIDSIMTRVGDNTRVIFAGDVVQTDLDGSRKNGECGMSDCIKAIDRIKSFASIKFTRHDIVRSDFVKSWIEASEDVLMNR